MWLTVKTVLQGGTVVEVDSLFPQDCVQKVTIVPAEQKMPISTNVLVDTNARKEVQILCLVTQDITKTRPDNQPVQSAHVGSTAMIPMAQSSHMANTSA